MADLSLAAFRSTLLPVLRRPVRFVDAWWLPLGVGAAGGAAVVFIILFLEPSGTDRYDAPFRTLRLSGYGLCVLLPFLVVHGLCRVWLDRSGAVWRLWHELLALAAMLLLIFYASYAYMAIVINQLPLSAGDWLVFTVRFAAPYLLVLVPPMLLARRALIAVLGNRVGEERIVLKGRNREDRLRLAASDFLFAEAEQNYVTIHYLRREEAHHRMFRASLAEIDTQLPDCLRVHRSFLVNPARVLAIEGNARKRIARLEGADRSIPVSPKFELARLEVSEAGAARDSTLGRIEATFVPASSPSSDACTPSSNALHGRHNPLDGPDERLETGSTPLWKASPTMTRLHRYFALALAAFVAFCALPTQAANDVDSPARAALVEKITATTESAVADPRWVSGPEWQAFKQVILDPEVQALDDADFRSAFNHAAEDLPFTHFRLRWRESRGKGSSEPTVTLDWPREDVARLRIRMFAGDSAEFTARMNEVIEAAPEGFILDLRGTPGGSFPTAVALSRALINEPMDAGAWLARGWFERHGEVPDATQYEAITALETLDLAAYVEKLRREGATRLILPGHDHPIFEGRVIVLTDSNTGSACEPLVDRMQHKGITVVGERTAGAMLSAELFPMDETFKLFLPVADYVTPNLVRLDRRGVVPDVEVPGDEALERALEMLQATESS
jgi:carboxyl-terminal processing protease